MENQNNNKGVIALLIVIIVILSVLCVLFATGTISFNSNKINDNNMNETINDNNQNENSNDDNLEEEKLPEWVTYLLNKNIKNITVHRTFIGEGFDPNVGCLESKQITSDDLTQILEKMTKGKLIKYLDAGGFGGPCLTNIVIEYNENEKLELFLYKYIITEDATIVSLLEKEEYTEDNTYNLSIDEPNTLFAYEWDDSFIETLFK